MQRATARVGVREFRRHLARYLERVGRGETVEITDRGRPVALLTPMPAPDTPLARLVAAGRVRAPAGDLLALGPPRGRPSTRLSDALAAQRAERL